MGASLTALQHWPQKNCIIKIYTVFYTANQLNKMLVLCVPAGFLCFSIRVPSQWAMIAYVLVRAFPPGMLISWKLCLHLEYKCRSFEICIKWIHANDSKYDACRVPMVHSTPATLASLLFPAPMSYGIWLSFCWNILLPDTCTTQFITLCSSAQVALTHWWFSLPALSTMLFLFSSLPLIHLPAWSSSATASYYCMFIVSCWTASLYPEA